MTAYDADVLFRERRVVIDEGPTLVDIIDQHLVRVTRENRDLRAKLRRRHVVDLGLVLAAVITAAACVALQ